MHEGHRRRLTEKVLRGDKLFGHEILEAVLFRAVPRIDLNAAAHNLIERFDGLEGVMNADVGGLSQVEGVGKSTAEYLVCLSKVLKRCGRGGSFAVVNTTERFKEFLNLRPEYDATALEVLILDRDARVRRVFTCFPDKGGIKDKLFKVFSASKPYGIYAALRRVGGVYPCAEGDGICAVIAEVARICAVHFFDFCIDAEDGFFSYNVEERGIFGNG